MNNIKTNNIDRKTVDYINNSIQELKKEQLRDTKESNKKLEEEYKKLFYILLGMIISFCVKTQDKNIRKSKILLSEKELKENLHRYKNITVNKQVGIICTLLSSIYIKNYNKMFEVFKKCFKDHYKKIYMLDTEDYIINDVINKDFKGKTLDKRIKDNTDIIFNKLDRVIDISLQGRNLDERDYKNITDSIDKLINTELQLMSMRLLDTESSRIFKESEIEIFKENDIYFLAWNASFCKNTCEECANNDEGIFSIVDEGLIPLHSNCNCYWSLI